MAMPSSKLPPGLSSSTAFTLVLFATRSANFLPSPLSIQPQIWTKEFSLSLNFPTPMSAACAGVIDHASRASSPAVIVFNIVVIHVFWACSSVRFVQHRKASFRCFVACCLVRDLLLVAKHLLVAARTAAWACGHPGLADASR